MNIGNLIYMGLMIVCVFLGYIIATTKKSTSRFIRFLWIMVIGLICSCIPLGLLGLAFGAPSVILASILISLFLDKDGKE